MKVNKYNLIIGALLVIFLIQGIIAIKNDGITADEPYHLATAYIAVNDITAGRNAYESPILSKYIIGIPLKFEHYKIDIPQQYLTYFLGPPIGQAMMFNNQSMTDRIIFWSRFSMLLIGIGLFFLVYLFSKEFFGKKVAIFSLALFTFEPNILAHTHLMTTDATTTVCVVAALYFLYKLLKNPCYKFTILTFMFLGLALTAKHSSLIFIPIAAIIIAVYLIKTKSINFDYKIERLKKYHNSVPFFALFIIITSVILIPLTINAVYFFDGTGSINLKELAPKSHKLDAFNIAPINEIKIPLPDKYLYGLDYSLTCGEQDNPLPWYFFGKDGDQPREYFLVSFLVKTQIILLLLFIAAIILTYKSKNRFDIILFLIIPIFGILLFNSFFNNMLLGIRYMLTMYPLIIILAGLVFLTIEHNKYKKWILIGIFTWAIISSLSAGFNYLTYYNEFVGGPYNGYKYSADSNLDWGQDVPRFKTFLEEHRNDPAFRNKNMSFMYWGNDIPQARGVTLPRPDCNISSGYLAMSVNYLYRITLIEPKDCLIKLRGVEPTYQPTPTIVIYDMDNIQVNK
jgi:hypothetical protein